KGREVKAEEARKQFKDNKYKLELIDEIVAKNEPVTLYTAGNFTDLCRGGHSDEPAKDISPDSFKLSRIAGAYWRGDEANAMLTRIYGYAFDSAEELKAYEDRLAAAAARDHKKLGKELDLFTFSDLVGSGLPLWTPKGMLMREILDGYVWQLRHKEGYQKVEIPHITKRDLYERSGHWDKFKDELFKITTRENHVFAMKPMNCPHHTQIYARKLHSYKELPQRYANTTMVYRDEQSGELAGLSRVRCITQDDAHVFCRHNQVKEEMLKVWNIINTFYSTVGFKLSPRLSLHDPKHMDKYLGTESEWVNAENALRDIVREKGVNATESVGEAAFYGPKIDFMAEDSLGREWQVATIQLDMNLPERFDLYCMNEKGEQERIVMIHCAIMGSIERYMSILIEHYAGNFPLWLSPVQVAIIPVGEAHHERACEVRDALVDAGLRCELDLADTGFGKKVRNAKNAKIPYFIIIGDKDIDAGKITLESRDKGNLGQKDLAEVVKELVRENEEKR
ncbi:MAG: threonine--tRNA ligase, partial [Patescibacteria group bacterium]|nr:threonine--tRNA ligase [Patescibacteria group bacterium]